MLGAILAHSTIPHMSLVNVAESEYILCRKLGHSKAAKQIDDLLASGYLVIEDDPSIHRRAAEAKCSRAISIGDCYTLAVSHTTSSTPIFAHMEEDLLKEIQHTPFSVRPFFLDSAD